MSYDTNVIVEFLSGSGDDTITTGTARLKRRVNAPDDQVVTISQCGPRPFGMSRATRRELGTALGALTTQSRLYLRGHGDWQARTLGGWLAHEVAGALALCQLRLSPALISVTGCRCARALAPGAEGKSFSGYKERHDAENVLLEISTHSFAGLLHGALRKHGITSPVYGRIYTVTVVGEGDEDLSPGQKITATPSGDERHHRRHSKIMFTWNGATQQQQWVY